MPAPIATESNRPAYAGLWPRFSALVIDLFLFCLIFFPVTRLVKGVWLMSTGDHLWGFGWMITDPLCIAFLIVMFLYFVVLEGFWGSTLGKALMNLQVVRAGGGRPGLVKAFFRNVLRLIDGLPALNILGVVLIVRSPVKARFGDRVAGTRVVSRPQKVQYWKKFVEFLKNDHIQASFCSGVCIIVLAYVFKKMLHVKVSVLEDAIPGYIFTLYEAARAKSKKRIISRPLLWNIAMLLATGLIILRRFLAQ